MPPRRATSAPPVIAAAPWTSPVPLLAAVAILAGISGWVATATFQQDFAAYYTAAAAVARRLDPYVNHLPSADGPWDGIAIFQHSRFLYAPLMADLFRPIAVLPYGAAKALFAGISAAALLAALLLVARDTRATAHEHAPAHSALQAGATWLMPLLWVLWPPVFLTLERGQIDLL
ncbi:MAG: DUF2029 domain-containing protein, partial [Deltaproteobacteria bacterium]|nr:DUF2029 domain-containing protein [Deltaproteobacteria bacterium]